MTDSDVTNHPRFNPRLIGHGHAEQRFLSTWQSERLPHGWLLTGPRGIGKATLAFRIARFVLSNGGDQAAAPGLFGEPVVPSLGLDAENPVFRRIASGGHADLMTLERTINPDTNKLRNTIAVEDVRRAGDFLRLTASEGGWRVVIIDSVDELNVNAANALLKILEEPPDRALMLLVCHAPGRLLPTIRSRCCQMPLTPLQDEEVISILQRVIRIYRQMICSRFANSQMEAQDGPLLWQSRGGWNYTERWYRCSPLFLKQTHPPYTVLVTVSRGEGQKTIFVS